MAVLVLAVAFILFGRIFKLARRAMLRPDGRVFTLNDVKTAIGGSTALWSDFENGRRLPSCLATVQAYADLLGLDLAALFEEFKLVRDFYADQLADQKRAADAKTLEPVVRA